VMPTRRYRSRPRSALILEKDFSLAAIAHMDANNAIIGRCLRYYLFKTMVTVQSVIALTYTKNPDSHKR
jgi:hypothetical protein